MIDNKVVIRLLKENLKFHEVFGRLQKAYDITRTDEEMLNEVENVLDMYRELKKESEREK